MKGFFNRRSVFKPSPIGAMVSYAILICWSIVVLFPLYWLLVTSFKLPGDVDNGPFYIPWGDFIPKLDNWRYIFVDIRDDTLRPYFNTVFVALVSSVIALTLGTAAAYALVRFTYQPRLGVIGLFIACVAVAALAIWYGGSWPIVLVAAIAVFVLLTQTIGRRFRRALGNSDIAFWMISQRMMPPVAVVIPIYVLFQRLGWLDTYQSLIISYVAANLPIVVWLMRDYFQSIPIELEECAAIDGASRYRTFWSIVLPLSLPGLVATFLFILVFAWNEYLLALFLSSSKVQTMPLLVAGQSGTRGPQWWYMSVVILIMIVPVIAVAIALERYIARGLLVGAVKG
jgi:multiple sugar transport system permease protein